MLGDVDQNARSVPNLNFKNQIYNQRPNNNQKNRKPILKNNASLKLHHRKNSSKQDEQSLPKNGSDEFSDSNSMDNNSPNNMQSQSKKKSIFLILDKAASTISNTYGDGDNQNKESKRNSLELPQKHNNNKSSKSILQSAQSRVNISYSQQNLQDSYWLQIAHQSNIAKKQSGKLLQVSLVIENKNKKDTLKLNDNLKDQNSDLKSDRIKQTDRSKRQMKIKEKKALQTLTKNKQTITKNKSSKLISDFNKQVKKQDIDNNKYQSHKISKVKQSDNDSTKNTNIFSPKSSNNSSGFLKSSNKGEKLSHFMIVQTSAGNHSKKQILNEYNVNESGFSIQEQDENQKQNTHRDGIRQLQKIQDSYRSRKNRETGSSFLPVNHPVMKQQKFSPSMQSIQSDQNQSNKNLIFLKNRDKLLKTSSQALNKILKGQKNKQQLVSTNSFKQSQVEQYHVRRLRQQLLKNKSKQQKSAINIINEINISRDNRNKNKNTSILPLETIQFNINLYRFFNRLIYKVQKYLIFKEKNQWFMNQLKLAMIKEKCFILMNAQKILFKMEVNEGKMFEEYGKISLQIIQIYIQKETKQSYWKQMKRIYAKNTVSLCLLNSSTGYGLRSSSGFGIGKEIPPVKQAIYNMLKATISSIQSEILPKLHISRNNQIQISSQSKAMGLLLQLQVKIVGYLFYDIYKRNLSFQNSNQLQQNNPSYLNESKQLRNQERLQQIIEKDEWNDKTPFDLLYKNWIRLKTDINKQINLLNKIGK